MISGKKLALQKNHWKVYLLILFGLLYNLHLTFQINPKTDLQRPDKPLRTLNLPDSASNLGVAADSLENKETYTQQF